MNSAVVSGKVIGPSRALRRARDLVCQPLRLTWLLPLFLVLTWSSDALAYAWMIRHGYVKCNTCHTDPSGGELLSHMGRVQSEQLLSADWGNSSVTSDAKLFYSLDEPEPLRLGGSARYMGIYDLDASELRHFPMQLDAYGQADFGTVRVGGSIGYADIPPYSPHMRKAQLFEDDGEGGPNLVTRTHWVGFDLDDEWLVRVGRLNLPFGLRVSEHVLFVREATHTDRESDQQHGVALSYSGGRWRGEGMFVLGNYQVSPDAFRERGFVGFAEYALGGNLALGASTQVLQSAKSLATRSDSRTIRHAHGGTLRWAPTTPLVVMAEANVLKTTGYGMGYVGMVNADYELRRGLHLALTGEFLDAGKPEPEQDTAGEDLPVEAIPGAGKLRKGLWLTAQWFFYTHWDFRADVVMRQDASTTLQGQFHFYF